MPYRIQFKHSQRHVVAQAQETILAAAIRCGVQVDYGCNNGQCGQCLAHLVHGEIKQVEHSDYVLSANAKQANGFLMCTHTACSDLQLDARIVSSDELTRQKISARLSRKVYLHEGRLCQLVLRLRRQQRLHFFAGQYVLLGSEHFPLQACSVASCPCDVSCLEFHISQQADTALRDYVFSSAQIGDRLMVEGPLGDFTLPAEIQNPVVFIAADLGFAAIKSLLEHLLAQEVELPIHLYRLHSQPDFFYLENLCRAWRDAFDNLTYHQLAMDHNSIRQTIIPAIERLSERQPVDVYVCAEHELLEVFKQLSLPPARMRLHTEPIRLLAPTSANN